MKNFIRYKLTPILELKQHSIICLICKSRDDIEDIATNIAFFNPDVSISIFSGWDSLPYDRMSPSQVVMSNRLKTLTELSKSSEKKRVLITDIEGLTQRTIPRDMLEKMSINLTKGEQISRDLLQESLVEMGFIRLINSVHPGEYSIRGSVVDIVVDEGRGYRLDFFGDTLESIRIFDTDTQISGEHANELSIIPTNEIILSSKTIENFKVKYLAKFGITSDQLYESITQGHRYAGMENWLPLYYENTSTVFDYLADNTFIFAPQDLDLLIEEREQKIINQYQYRVANNTNSQIKIKSDYYPLQPNELYLDRTEIKKYISKFKAAEYSLSDSDIVGLDFVAESRLAQSKQADTNQPIDLLKQKVLNDSQNVHILCCYSERSRDKVENVLKEHEINYYMVDNFTSINNSPGLFVTILSVDDGFKIGNKIFYSEKSVFGERLTKAKKKKASPNIFNELNSLIEGELVVHIEHGIARFAGLETLKVLDSVHDFVKLVYADNDKLYLPVENLDLLSKFGGEDAQLDKLGSLGWQTRKAKIKNRIKIAAESLLKIAANRELCKSEPVYVITDMYEKFCQKFPYLETDDQLNAIEDVINDLQGDKPMDRLICGDVGYGKTEVALRTAFFIAASQRGAQVAVLVPTTLLARQHYKTFTERFADFPFRIKQLSRFTPQSEVKKIKAEVAEGKVDIVIGTHALLAKDVKFNNLGMLIIDEEQHFGVGQKEKLKGIKENCHVLTLSATPIPRTLQMSLTGIRELSILGTPPIDRLPIRSYLMPLDKLTIREAILREIHRGGRVFYVTPRIAYLDSIMLFLQEIIPEAKVVSAHGQLPPGKLDTIMNEFYDGKFDVLISTTIVESGLDIPMANTIIVDRAHMFGLAQLYQIRGRVGRGNAQAYAYLTYPSGMRLNPEAEKRLSILQSLDSLGGGFSIASHDMDMRGYGNLVGEEQSGQIKEIGIELYQQMLKDAILALKENVEVKEDWSPILNIGLSVQIPESYIPDASLRLSLYRRIAALDSEEELERFADELVDRFGKIPEEAEHLLQVVNLKAIAKAANVEKVDLGEKALVITFKNNSPAKPEKVLSFIESSLGQAKLRPDGKLVIQVAKKQPDSVLQYLQRFAE